MYSLNIIQGFTTAPKIYLPHELAAADSHTLSHIVSEILSVQISQGSKQLEPHYDCQFQVRS